MDIRNFFAPVTKQEKKRKNIVSDSDEEDPIPSKIKRTSILVSDSDDDKIFNSGKKKKHQLSKRSPSVKKKSSPKRAVKSIKLKEVTSKSFFGSAPITQSKLPVPSKRKIEVVTVAESNDDDDDDDDFAQTLLELDEIEIKKVKQKQVDESNHPKENSPPNKMKVEISSKLSSKMNKSSSKLSVISQNSPRKTIVSPLKDRKRKRNSDDCHLATEKIVEDLPIHKKVLGNDETKRKLSPLKSIIKSDAKSPKSEVKATTKSDVKASKKDVKASKTESRNSKSDVNTPKSKLKAAKSPNKTPISILKNSKSSLKTPASDNKKIKSVSIAPKGSSAKSKLEFTKNESPKVTSPKVPATPESDEKRRQSTISYMKYLHRAGPKNPGGRALPVGKSNCLLGFTFVLTGVLETIDREETAELIKKYGGRVTTSLSRNTKYLVTGDEPGESKMKKAVQLGTSLLNEDELFSLVSSTYCKEEEITAEAPTKASSVDSTSETKLTFSRRSSDSPSKSKLKVTDVSSPSSQTISSSQVSSSSSNKSSDSGRFSSLSMKKSPDSSLSSSPVSQTSSISSEKCTSLESDTLSSTDNMMWVDRYKPASLKNIIGQQGEQSNAKKLVRWLTNWFENQSGNKKLTKPNLWSKDNTGAYFKSALLSGPPGVGKTTTVHLAAKELGFDLVELNASDSRSKKTLTEHVLQLLTNQSLASFARGNAKSATSRRHLLVMDEVDGMAGNEDRGGVQELISLIKSTKIPVICMCNDRNHQKIRSLSNHCFDLRFNKPKIEQIRGAMMSVCFKEGVKIKPDALDQVIIGSNQDLRQILHHLSMWSADQKILGSDDMKRESKMAKKDMKMGPWDVVNKVFSESANKDMSIHDKVSLFFHDYSIGPLFVQENYLKVLPHCARGNPKKMMQQIAKTACILTDYDLVDKIVRSESAWSLLPTQALYGSVLPGYHMAGHFSSQIEFPKWLGNNSRRNKFDRLSQELHTHMRLRISGSKRDIVMDYGSMVKQAVIEPLVKRGSDGVKDAVDAMTSHDLVRDDLDSLIELSSWPGFKDPMSKVETKVKSAFTRSLNKDAHMNPFSTGSAAPKKKVSSMVALTDDEEQDLDDNEEEDDDDVSKNNMIKAVKKKSDAPKKKSTSKGVSKKGKK